MDREIGNVSQLGEHWSARPRPATTIVQTVSPNVPIWDNGHIKVQSRILPQSRNMLINGYQIAELMNFTDKDRLVIRVPLYHCFGMVMGNLGLLTHGHRENPEIRDARSKHQGVCAGSRCENKDRLITG